LVRESGGGRGQFALLNSGRWDAHGSDGHRGYLGLVRGWAYFDGDDDPDQRQEGTGNDESDLVSAIHGVILHLAEGRDSKRPEGMQAKNRSPRFAALPFSDLTEGAVFATMRF
jgi:hypothetical protein